MTYFNNVEKCYIIAVEIPTYFTYLTLPPLVEGVYSKASVIPKAFASRAPPFLLFAHPPKLKNLRLYKHFLSYLHKSNTIK